MHLVPELTIDLIAIQANYKLLREKAAPAETSAVVKANAYGVDVTPVSRMLYETGCRTFFTAYLEEAIQIRKTLHSVLVAPLHGLHESEFAEARQNDITPVLNSLEDIQLWSEFAHKRSEKLPAFIHLDTGMNRLGLSPTQQDKLIAEPHCLLNFDIKGWMTHFANAEDFDDYLTARQRERFKKSVTRLPSAKLSLCNSSGIFWGKDYLFDLVRPGVALYGVNPTPKKPNPMRGVIELKAPILQTRGVDTDMTVGYGATYRVTRKGRIATVALGYADGYLRSLSNQGKVKIGEHLAPIVGRISMDLITVDVSDIPETVAHPGVMATVIGPHRPVDTVAAEGSTTGYEILAALGARLKRHYIEASGA